MRKFYDLTTDGGWKTDLPASLAPTAINLMEPWPGDMFRVRERGEIVLIRFNGTGDFSVFSADGSEHPERVRMRGAPR